MVHVQTSNKVEVVSDKHEEEGPLEIARCIHSEDKHDDEKLEEKCRLKDAIVPKEAYCIVVLIHVLHIRHYILGRRINAKPLLETVIHQRQVRQKKVLLR